MAERAIFRWFSASHSVIGGSISVPLNRAAIAKASMVYLPVGFCTIVLVVLLFVAALAVTSELVKAIDRGERPDLRAAASDLRWKTVLALSIKFLAACVIAAILAFLVATFPSPRTHYSRLTSSSTIGEVLAVVSTSLAVWWVAPATMRFLRSQRKFRPSRKYRLQAGLFSASATSVGIALGVLLQKAEASLIVESHWQFEALAVFNSFVANVPALFLFVALALLAASDEQGGTERSGMRGFLQMLMPLHFQDNDKPE